MVPLVFYMEVVNADAGNGVMPANAEDRTWYRWYRFPLLPIWHRSHATKWSCGGFELTWLNFSIWSMMSPDIGVEVKLEDQGLYFRIYPPYLIIHIWLLYFPAKWHQKWWMKGHGREDEE